MLENFHPKYLMEIPSNVWYHVSRGNINPYMTVYFTAVHAGVAYALWYEMPKAMPETIVFTYIFAVMSGLGITVGAHRLWAHRTFEAHWTVRLVLMLLNCIANQRSLLHWCRDHRVHHKASETIADPHNATRGFFFAHIGWLLLLKDKAVHKAGNAMDFSDLYDDPIVMFQARTDPFLALYMSFYFPAQVAQHFWGEDFWTAFFVAGVFRYAFVLHCTFLVNSAAHLYGDRTYDTGVYPAENPWVSLFTNGEGWHSWHHKYPYDYAAAEFGVLEQFNPSKVVIDALAAVGLVWNRKRATHAWKLGRVRRDKMLAEGATLPKPSPRSWEEKAQ